MKKKLGVKESFSLNLRIILASKRMSASDVSEATGIARSTLSAILNEKTERVAFQTIEKLCTHLEISPESLFKNAG